VNDFTTVVGLDVAKNSIAVAVLPLGSERVSERTMIPHDVRALEKLARRVTANGPAVFVYEAGPCGYHLHRQITERGHRCVVVAPGLIPVRPTDRVKTDRRDAEKLARLYRAGELTEIRVPERQEEAARDLTRARGDTLGDRLRARHRLSKFLLRQGRVFRGSKGWDMGHRQWLRGQVFEWPAQRQTFEAYLRTLEEAEARLQALDQQVDELAQTAPYRTPVRYLRCLKGVDTLTALTLVAEARHFARFGKATGFMAFTGLVSSEWSSGETVRRGAITKAGNAHIRRVLGEAAWCYRSHTPLSTTLAKRREGCPYEVLRIAQAADRRLHRKFRRLVARGKPHQVAVTAVARELAGFAWAIARLFPPTA